MSQPPFESREPPSGVTGREPPSGATDHEPPSRVTDREPPSEGASQRGFGFRGGKAFTVLLAGQIVSFLGSRLSSFGLGVWIFMSTGSTTKFALTAFVGAVTSLLVAPLAGVMVDRWDRRWTMIFGDTGAALGTAALALLLWSQRIELWHIYLILAFAGFFQTFQGPAFEATVSLLVPKKHLGRASGMLQFGSEGTRIMAPPIAGLLLPVIGLAGLLTIDFITFLVSILSLLLIWVPRPERTQESRRHEGSLRQELTYGWHYLVERKGFMGLIAVAAAVNFSLGMVMVLFTPLVLSFTSPAMLGVVLAGSALGGMTGGLLMGVWGGPKRRVRGLFVFLAVQGSILLLGGLKPNVPLVAGAAFVFMLCAPVIHGCSQAIWLSKVAPDVQGRVFSIRRVIATVTLPLSLLLAGPLADYVFEPLLAEGGALAGTVGQIIGVGPGRGIGLMLIVLGVLMLLALAFGSLYRPLQRLEEELPDVVRPEGDAT